MRQLYSHARLYVLSSVNEGFPLVLLEAMNYKLPIIASNIPATDIPQMSADNYFQTQNSDSLAEAIKRKLSNPQLICEYELGEYDWDRIAEQTLEVYKGL